MQEQSSHNDIWFLIARSLSGEATIAEQERLQQLLQQDASFQQQYELLTRMWHAGEKQNKQKIDEAEKENISRILQLAKKESEDYKLSAKPGSIHKKYLYAITSAAAAIIIIVAIVWMFSINKTNNNTAVVVPHTQTLIADNGNKTRTILPDGSTVWVNAGSHISYNENLSGPLREVTLDGEAYFDVVKQPKRPFIVHVSGYNIKVLGTAFNVKSYPEDKTVETTLLRGLVEVTKEGAEKQKPIFLHPNEKLILGKIAANDKVKLPDNIQDANQETTGFTIKHLDSALKEKEIIETAWVYNRLEFRGESFEQLAGKLERWYNVKIFFDDYAVRKLNFNGSFEDETIEQALVALKTATAFGYTINGKEIHIKSLRQFN